MPIKHTRLLTHPHPESIQHAPNVFLAGKERIFRVDWWGLEWGGCTPSFPPTIYRQKAIWPWGRVTQRPQVSACRCSHLHSCVQGSGNYRELMESRFSGLLCFYCPTGASWRTRLVDLSSIQTWTSWKWLVFCLLSSSKADVKPQGSVCWKLCFCRMRSGTFRIGNEVLRPSNSGF